jgi:ABC-type lipoprotein release transport system permease subunit
MGHLLLIALRNLGLNRRRNLLLGSAIAAVTALMILLGAVGNGIQVTMIDAGTALVSGHVNVAGFYKITAGRPAPVLVDRQKVLDQVRTLVPEARLIVDRTRGFGKFVSETDSVQTGLTGLDIERDREILRVVRVVQGRIDDLAGPGKVMLYEAQARRLGVGIGDRVTLTAPVLRGINNSIDVDVVAIAKDLGLLSVMSCYVSKETIRDLYLLDPDTTGVIQVYLDDPDDAGAVEARVKAGLERLDHRLMDKLDVPYFHKFQSIAAEDWTGQKLDVSTWKDELSMLDWTLKTFDTVTMLLTAILLVIIVVGVMNTLWISIRERTREIGTLRAIGMARWRVLVMMLLEVAALAVLSTATGLAAGGALTVALNWARIPVSEGFQMFLLSDTLTLVLEPASVMAALVWIPLLITCFSVFPALRAARMRPITAIHHVG